MRAPTRVVKPPIGICDGDMLQLFHLFSPDLKHAIDIEPMEKSWVVRTTDEGLVHYKIPRSMLPVDPRHNFVSRQTRFFKWESNTRITMLDIHADPFIGKTIDISLNEEVSKGEV